MESSSPKRVRFANVAPQTPSPASTSTSLGSSPGPFTPPQLLPVHLAPTIVRPTDYPPSPHHHGMGMPTIIRMPSPMHSLALVPATAEGDVAIDPLIAAPFDPKHPPPLKWDVGEHPDAIELGSIGAPGARQLSHDDLASCAVRTSAKGSPAMLRRMLLVFPGLPLTVEIEPADAPVWTSRPLPYLAVGDVLLGLYGALRLSVGQRTLSALPTALREAMDKAFRRRLLNDRKNYDRNVRHGVRQVDYLGEKRVFVGLRPAAGAEVPYGRRNGEVFVVQLASV